MSDVPFHELAALILAGVNILALLGGLWKLHSIASHVERTFDFFAMEHELLVRDYCERKGIEMTQMPTRLTSAPWWAVRGKT